MPVREYTMMNKNIFSIIISATFIFINSLAGTKQDIINSNNYNKSAGELLTEGENCLYQKKWSKGRDLLQHIEAHLPSSPEFATAKLTLADSFFFESKASYPEAIMHYTDYLTLFPESQKKDYALFHIGLCLCASINKVERDQTNTIKTIEAFENLLKEVPNSIYAADAQAKIEICKRQLAETDLRVGITYVRSFNYEAGEKRINYALDTHKNHLDRKRAYFFLAEAIYKGCLKMNKDKNSKRANKVTTTKDANTSLQQELQHTNNRMSEARAYYEKLIKDYPSTIWAIRANDRLMQMGQVGLPNKIDN